MRPASPLKKPLYFALLLGPVTAMAQADEGLGEVPHAVANDTELRVLIKRTQAERLNFRTRAGGSFYVEGQGLVSSLSCEFLRGQSALSWVRDFVRSAELGSQMVQSPFAGGDWRCLGSGGKYSLLRPGLLMRNSETSEMITKGNYRFRGGLRLHANNSRLHLVNYVPLEDYLVGLINKEIRSDYPDAVVKAQAIAARSYALATLEERRNGQPGRWFDLRGTEADQVYQGAQTEDVRARRLVEATRGITLQHQNRVLKAYYHASAGGYSELPHQVWGGGAKTESTAYLARPSPWDRSGSASTAWRVRISPQMGEAWEGVGRIRHIQPLTRSSGRRVTQLLIRGEKGDLRISGEDLRRRLGFRWVRSTLFTVRREADGSFMIEGTGFGHGVGMSQLGAKAMAEAGKGLDEILSFYYPYASLSAPIKAAQMPAQRAARLPSQMPGPIKKRGPETVSLGAR